MFRIAAATIEDDAKAHARRKMLARGAGERGKRGTTQHDTKKKYIYIYRILYVIIYYCFHRRVRVQLVTLALSFFSIELGVGSLRALKAKVSTL